MALGAQKNDTLLHFLALDLARPSRSAGGTQCPTVGLRCIHLGGGPKWVPGSSMCVSHKLWPPNLYSNPHSPTQLLMSPKTTQRASKGGPLRAMLCCFIPREGKRKAMASCLQEYNFAGEIDRSLWSSLHRRFSSMYQRRTTRLLPPRN